MGRRKAPARRRRQRRKPPKLKAPAPALSSQQILEEVAKPVAVESGGQLVTGAVQVAKPPAPVTLEAPERSYEFLRFSAGLAYTTDLNGISVEELSKRPPFAGAVPIKTLKEWATKDQWVARREAISVEWRKAVEAKMGQRQVQQALVDLESTDMMVADALDKLARKMGTVSSYEGLVNATVRLMEFRASLRGQVLVAVAPAINSGVTVGVSAQMPRPKLSAEEARAAATTILKLRREEIRSEQAREEQAKEAAKQKAADSGTEAPPLRLLPGEKKT